MSTSFHPNTAAEIAAELDAKARAQQIVDEFNPTPSKSPTLLFLIENALMQWFTRGVIQGIDRSSAIVKETLR